MGTKSNPTPNDCYDKALPDEPIFTLLGRDPDAAAAILYWAERRAKRAARTLIGDALARELDKIGEALHCANAMTDYVTAAGKHVPALLDYIGQQACERVSQPLEFSPENPPIRHDTVVTG